MAKAELDLTNFKDAAEKVRGREGSTEYQLNLACWLGERAYLLIAEIERLRELVNVDDNQKVL